ncbi:ankyrin repeat and SOCS box protein 17-like [Sardina pilchardus]|uniref:ankyrin repeat and SOCS box protein 17-like n=1 Tax=Sardina pilchardus TaxID=27697 RepID=UPI002E13A47E
MSDSEDSSAERNVFLSLVSRVIRHPPYRFPEQWGQETYEPRIYKTLGNILRNVSSEVFESFISDFITFAQTAHARLDTPFYIEFINICTNTILYWVFARRRSVEIVRTLMARTSYFLHNQSDSLAIAWRSFTPIYSPSPMGGLTPLMFVAQNRQYDVLKVLLQYGMLERELRPTYIIICILFNPPRLEVLDEQNPGEEGQSIRECVELCSRVLTSISINDIEMQILYGRVPMIADWRDCLPITHYQEPCELTQLCRVAVRAHLLKMRRLPDGLKDLPLPSRLQAFLNIEF